MKALSIRQPWAWLIVNGWKDIENRTWFSNFRGNFYIHASKAMTRREYDEAKYAVECINQHCLISATSIILPAPFDLKRGGIVGMAEMTRCVTDHPSPWFSGPYGFVLTKAIELPFQPMTGSLGFFEGYL